MSVTGFLNDQGFVCGACHSLLPPGAFHLSVINYEFYLDCEIKFLRELDLYFPYLVKIVTSNPVPAIFHVCQASRAVALKHYQLSFSTIGSKPRTYFDFEIDNLYIPHLQDWDGYTYGTPERVLLNPMSPTECTAIKHLTVECREPNGSWENGLFCLFPNVEVFSRAIYDFTPDKFQTSPLSTLNPYQREQEVIHVEPQLNKPKYASAQIERLCEECDKLGKKMVPLRIAYFMKKYHIIEPTLPEINLHALKQAHPGDVWNVPKCREVVVSTLSVQREPENMEEAERKLDKDIHRYLGPNGRVEWEDMCTWV